MPDPALQRRIVAVVQMPPPVNGLAVVNAAMTGLFAEHGLLAATLDVAPPPGASRARLIAARLAQTAAAAAGLARWRLRGADILYMPPDAAGGLALNVALLLAARLLGYAAWFHHHNFSYIDAHQPMMARLIAWSPRGATHIVLCDAMGERLAARYPAAWRRCGARVIALNNSFLLDTVPVAEKPDTLTIGHLSNLTVEKGALRFLALFRKLREAGVAIDAILAGPTHDPAIAQAIARAEADFPGHFRWLGPVHGAAKAAFYAGIDVFVFPTAYVNEAQPVVLLEALAAGAAVLSTTRGCIAGDHAASPGAIIDDAAFDAGAYRWLAEAAATAAIRAALPAHARAAFATLRQDADATLAVTLRQMTRS